MFGYVLNYSAQLNKNLLSVGGVVEAQLPFVLGFRQEVKAHLGFKANLVCVSR